MDNEQTSEGGMQTRVTSVLPTGGRGRETCASDRVGRAQVRGCERRCVEASAGASSSDAKTTAEAAREDGGIRGAENTESDQYKVYTM